MSIVLAWDCSVSGLSIAVCAGDRAIAQVRQEGRDQAASLFPAVADVLRAAGLERRDLTLLAVTVGPGSFTGVRLGLAAARGLAVGLDLPLAGIATTSVLLAQAADRWPSRAPQRLAIVDTRLGDWYCASDATERPYLADTAHLVERFAGRPCRLLGTGAGRLAGELVAAGVAAEGEEALPDAAVLARLALARGEAAWRGERQDQGLPRPLYLRGVNVTLPDGGRRTVE
ncbi:MAG: tRNA (adenosine(37)-N6)-threonylcarbamoyltransferase complex dimerization subunit type 1 TsaB [Reyranellaceae bacterium]